MDKEQLLSRLNELVKKKKTITDFIESLEVQDEIHNIEMQLNNVKPSDSYMECEGCGS